MKLNKVARIINTRGLKGEVKIKSFTNMQTDKFAVGNILYIIKDSKNIPLKIKEYRVIKDTETLLFENHEDINLIEKYKGFELFINENFEVVLEENEYLLDDLIGIKIKQNGVIKGVVVDIITYPQGDYLVIETSDGERLIPFRDEFILSQNNETIEIIDMEGLLWK